MFTIWQDRTALLKDFDSVFGALSHMKSLNIGGKVKNLTGETIVSWNKTDGINWQNGLSPMSPIRISEAAMMLGLSYARLNQLCNQGRIGRKSGGGWIITLGELKKFADQKRLSGVGFNQQSKKDK